MHATLPLMEISDFPAIRRKRLDTLQVNLGYKCNQSCLHCHVNASPTRREMMSRETMFEVIAYLKATNIRTLDVTGGAPELNPNFRMLVQAARDIGVTVMDRCNLTILHEPGQESLADFLCEHGVEIVASLPCYLEDNVDKQRGKGVFETSIRALQKLNALGYGLTLGLQTRIDSRAQRLADAARIGNVYVNRNIIGAVVGVQPFGGEGMSGTGPKAGGPHYLYRFCAEQTLTVNTAAAGGNAALLAGLDTGH